jgi:hypothetical protein
MINGVLAFIFTLPILVPQLCIATPPGEFGCISSMETSWPGTWLLIGYLIFLTVGVFGMLGWGMTYYFGGVLFARTKVNGMLTWLHLVFFEIGVVGTTALLAAIGYVGGNWIAHGGAVAVAAQVVATKIIPPLSSDPNSVLNDMPPVVEAIFIGITVLGALIGFINIFMAKKESK